MPGDFLNKLLSAPEDTFLQAVGLVKCILFYPVLSNITFYHSFYKHFRKLSVGNHIVYGPRFESHSRRAGFHSSVFEECTNSCAAVTFLTAI